MADGRPHLVAVGYPPERAVRAGERVLPPRRKLVVPLLSVALVLCALGWGLARHEAGALSRELAATQGALAEAEGRLEALESQRVQVRTQVQALAADAAAFAGRLGELEASRTSTDGSVATAAPTCAVWLFPALTTIDAGDAALTVTSALSVMVPTTPATLAVTVLVAACVVKNIPSSHRWHWWRSPAA